MGVLDKIENKLMGNKAKDEAEAMEKKAARQHQLGGASQQLGGANQALGGHSSGHQGSSSTRADELRHPVQNTTGGAGGAGSTRTGEQYGGMPQATGQSSYGNDGYGQASTGQGQTYRDYGQDGYGQQSSRDKMQAVDPVDPRSVRGQAQLASSGQQYNTTGGQGHSSSRTQDPRDYDVDRSRHGGVTNSMRTGGGPNLENRDAIPTAGGEKVGGLGSGEGRHERDHHYGRDAAVVGGAGAGAAAIGEHEHHRHHHHHNNESTREERHHQGRDQYDQPGMTSTDQYGGQGSRYPQDASYGNTSGQGYQSQGYQSQGNQSQGMAGAGMAGAGMGAGAGAAGAGQGGLARAEEHMGGGGGQTHALPQEKKLGGAYEAGYRDAMAHIEAERNK